MTAVWKAHYLKFSQCLTPSISFLYWELEMFELGTYVAVACNTCGFLSQPFWLFSSLKLNGHSPNSVELNVRLGQYFATREVSLNSVRSLFAILGTHAPSENHLKKKNICIGQQVSRQHLSETNGTKPRICCEKIIYLINQKINPVLWLWVVTVCITPCHMAGPFNVALSPLPHLLITPPKSNYHWIGNLQPTLCKDIPR